MSESECLEAAVALVTLDLFSDEHSAAAYDTGTLLIIEGHSWQGNRWDAFWREENDRLAYVSWNLPREQLGVLGHLSTDSQSHAKGQDFQKWLSCIQSESLSSCKDTGLTDIEVIVYSENMERLSE